MTTGSRPRTPGSASSARASGGKILLEEFLKPLGMSQYRLAKEIGVPGPAGQRDCARPAADQRGHGAPAGAFFRHVRAVLDQLQSRYDLEVERERLGDALDDIRPLTAAS
jgi:plasmid maintenance system antidote protein VapI